jgi:DNA-binding transcriptional MerR regulator
LQAKHPVFVQHGVVVDMDLERVMVPSNTYTLRQLNERSGLSVRTIRYYIKEGLLGAPLTAGSKACYPAGHLPRLRLIRRLQEEQHMPLADIAEQLSELHELLRTSNPAEAAVRRVRTPTPTPVRLRAVLPENSHWERVVLHRDVEIQVRRPTTTAVNRRLHKLLALAKELFEEDKR